MTYEQRLDATHALSAEPTVDALGALQMIADPAAAIEAARRMEASCRTGLRFFSDFRRVRPLDSFDPQALDQDAELVDDGYPDLEGSPFDVVYESVFDPAFIRRR